MAEDPAPAPDPATDPLKRLVHDLRSPLMIVDGLAGLLVRDAATLTDDQRCDYAERIRAAAVEMRERLDAAVEERAGAPIDD